MGTVTVVTRPDNLPIEADDVRSFLQKDDPQEEEGLRRAIASATEVVSQAVDRTLLTTVYDWIGDPSAIKRPSVVGRGSEEWLYGSNLVGALELPRPPLASVTSVKTVVRGGTETIVVATSYEVDTQGGWNPGRVVFYELPSVGDLKAVGGLVVRFTAGYGVNGKDVPEPLREAVAKVAAQLFVHRVARNTGSAEGGAPSAATWKLITNAVAGLVQPYTHTRLG